MFGMLSVLAELQRELIVANTRDGLAAANARGRHGGRRPRLSGTRPRPLRRRQTHRPADRRHVQRPPLHRVRPPRQSQHRQTTSTGRRQRRPSPRQQHAMNDLISRTTRGLFRDLMTGSTLGEIGAAFQDELFAPNPDSTYQDSSSRRTLTQEYLEAVDWTDINQVNRVLRVRHRRLRHPPAAQPYPTRHPRRPRARRGQRQGRFEGTRPTRRRQGRSARPRTRSPTGSRPTSRIGDSRPRRQRRSQEDPRRGLQHRHRPGRTAQPRLRHRPAPPLGSALAMRTWPSTRPSPGASSSSTRSPTRRLRGGRKQADPFIITVWIW
jgi:hypothetical protein